MNLRYFGVPAFEFSPTPIGLVLFTVPVPGNNVIDLLDIPEAGTTKETTNQQPGLSACRIKRAERSGRLT